MIKDIYNLNPYSLLKDEKKSFLLQELSKLSLHHYENSITYKKIIDAFHTPLTPKNIEDFFTLPVRVFKEFELKSSSDIVKTLTSSGTTSSQLSKIYLDKQTAREQSIALVKIMQDFIGKDRVSMMIVDTKSVMQKKEFSARAAGIAGMAQFARKIEYILDDEMHLQVDKMLEFLTQNKDKKIVIFGFTFMVWEYFYKQLKKQNITLDMNNAILIHSGGWKKLTQEAVSNDEFKKQLKQQTNISKIHNFYGMVEQVGSVFVECESGHLHTPNFADVIIRDTQTLEALPYKQEGLVEIVSIIPKSYAGHILLSEDIGMILGEDDCSCGRKGKYFSIKGRVSQAQIRGCSDTFVK